MSLSRGAVMRSSVHSKSWLQIGTWAVYLWKQIGKGRVWVQMLVGQ